MVIFSASAPFTLSAIGVVFSYPLCALFWGTLFILLYKKTNNPTVIFLYPFLVALIQLMNFWLTAVFQIIGACLVLLFYTKLDRNKFSTLVLSYTSMIVCMYLGGTVPVIYFKDMFFEAIPAYTDLYTKVYNVLTAYVFVGGLVAAIICAIIGAFIGRIILKKHFENLVSQYDKCKPRSKSTIDYSICNEHSAFYCTKSIHFYI